MSFEEALEHLLEFEGGYVNDPDDAGGETFRGVSRRSWPDWAGWALIDAARAAGLRSARALDGRFARDAAMDRLVAGFYRANFWRPWDRLGLPARLTGKLFDTAVNVGTGRAAGLLQAAVNRLGPAVPLAVDGIVGPRTRAALDAALAAPDGEDRLLAACAEAQADHYRALVRARPARAKFLRGWLRRAAWIPV